MPDQRDLVVPPGFDSPIDVVVESGDLPDDVVAIGPRSGLQYVRPTVELAIELERLELEAFPTADPKDLYNRDELVDLAQEFPQGGVVGFVGDQRETAVAVGLGVRTNFDLENPQHNLKELFADTATESGDDPDGQWYYGTDIVVSPSQRRNGIGRELYELRKQICRNLGLRGIIAGGVIPGYADHIDEMTADDYIDKVRAGDLYDPTLSFQLGNGFDVLCALANYIKDPAVDNWASMIVWHNDQYREQSDQGVEEQS